MVLSIGIILDIPSQQVPQAPLELKIRTNDNLQLAYEVARRIMSEKVKAKNDRNATLSFLQFKAGDRDLTHKAYSPADGPDAKLARLWRGSYVVLSRLLPVVYRATREEDKTETTSVLLARMKPFLRRYPGKEHGTEPDDTLFLGRQIPLPELRSSRPSVQVGRYEVRQIDAHKRVLGAPSPTSFQYILVLEGWPQNMGLWRHHKAIPQCAELIESYRRKVVATDPMVFDTSKKQQRQH